MAMSSDVYNYRSPCLCVDSVLNRNGSHVVEVGFVKYGKPSNSRGVNSSTVELSSSFTDTWHNRRPSLEITKRKKKLRKKGSVVVDEYGGQYEEGFEDVHGQIINYFTYKAIRTVLHQLYEMNPPSYMWFYNFVADNKPTDGTRFLRTLGKEKQDLAERVMITRLHLYGKWIKKCDHAKMYQRISDENLQLMRERLMETVIWPQDDTNNTEKRS